MMAGLAETVVMTVLAEIMVVLVVMMVLVGMMMVLVVMMVVLVGMMVVTMVVLAVPMVVMMMTLMVVEMEVTEGMVVTVVVSRLVISHAMGAILYAANDLALNGYSFLYSNMSPSGQ